jgi:hypothetical protein
MKESIRDRILRYVYEQKGDKHEFVELQDFFISLATTSWYIGEELRGISMHRNRLLEVEPFKEMQFLGKKDRTVTIENTPFRAKLTAAGIAEVKRMLAEDTSVQLTKAQLKDFPRMSWQSRWGFWLAVASIVITILKAGWEVHVDQRSETTVPASRSTPTQEQLAPESAIQSTLKLDSVVTGAEPLPDTVPGKK